MSDDAVADDEPRKRRFISGDETAMPWSDRKLMRLDEEGFPLSLGAKMVIQLLDCAGLSRDQILAALDDESREMIYAALPDQKQVNIDLLLKQHVSRVSMEQIARVLDPVDERVDASRRQRPERANVGYAQMKQRFR